MSSNQPEIASLDLTNFVKDLKINDNPFGFKDAVESDTYFVPVPNNFYGFHIDLEDLFSPIKTEDIDYEDLTNQKFISDAK